MIFQYMQWPSPQTDIPHDYMVFLDIPEYSSTCSEFPRQTMTSWYSALFHDIPRVVWWGQPFSHFCGKGGSGADAPLRRYRNIPKVVLERPRGVLGLSAMHDITTYAIPLCSSIFSIIFNELPRQTITLVFIVFYDAPRYSMIFQYGQWASKTDKPWYHCIPYDSTKLFDTPWYSNICGDLPTDWYCTIFVEIPWYSSTRSELLKQTLTSHHDIPRCSTTFLVLFGEASLFLIFVARVARVPMPPSGDTEISPK